jgi:DNA-binding XRE family transcriptional regulator
MKLKLSALRVNAGLTQEEVAVKMHKNKATIGSWENYKTFPTSIELTQLCSLYNCSYDDIFIPDNLSKREQKGRINEKKF